ncbi:hypothetical protein FACS189491_12110 [Spirochaetia bacterium]|nr:hypothetical protein FACS189491_12110 [Spirochaetia bacterium]
MIFSPRIGDNAIRRGDVWTFLRDALPVIAVFAALIAIFIGIADLKDRLAAKKEETGNKDA